MSPKEKLYEFESARLISYFVVISVSIIFTIFKPFKTLCDLPKHYCPMCGMRTSIFYLVHGNYDMAVYSNPFIVVLLILIILIALDIIQILIKRSELF